MNIAIDVDDTLIELGDITYAYGQLYGKKTNNSAEVKDTAGLYAGDVFGWTEEVETKFYKEVMSEVVCNAPPRIMAKEVISKLKEDGHTIYIVTARQEYYFPNAYEKTEKWLKAYNIPFDYLHVNVQDKGQKCKQLDINAFIDDIEINCLSAAKEGIKTYMYNTISNKDFKSDEITRVYSWFDVYYKITGKMLEI